MDRLKAELMYERRMSEDNLTRFEDERRVWQEEKEKVKTEERFHPFPSNRWFTLALLPTVTPPPPIPHSSRSSATRSSCSRTTSWCTVGTATWSGWWGSWAWSWRAGTRTTTRFAVAATTSTLRRSRPLRSEEGRNSQSLTRAQKKIPGN